MTVGGIGRNLRLLLRHPSVFLGQRGYVLILSHMRSYSTLLAHLLGSHPEIAGYAEMNLPYMRRRDLLRLRAQVARSLEGELKGRFVLDKMLHDEHPLGRAILNDPDVYPVFLVRRPAETVSSILKMNERLPDRPLYPGEGEAVRYYAGRLATLAQLGKDRSGQACVVRAEDLVGKPDATLAGIARFLGLSTPIQTTYSTFPLTGVPGRGDFSDAIREGQIRQPHSSQLVELNPDVLAIGESAHAHCLETLESLFGVS
jgi:hypothetical protein